MAKFLYNPETLSYQKVERKTRYKIYRVLASMALVLGIGFVIILVRDEYFGSARLSDLTEMQNDLAFDLELMNRELSSCESGLKFIARNDDQVFRVYFEVEPWNANVREVGVGGFSKYDWLNNYKYSELLRSTYMNMDRVERKLVLQSTSYDELINLASHKEERMAARPAIQPVSMMDLVRFGSSFGMRYHPILKIRRMHEGIDLTAPKGTNIYATADGKVLQAGYRAGGFGKKVLLDHGFGYRTLYGHCNEVLVEPGQAVKRGEVIARVGSTGLSKSPHLHYEVHLNGHPVDPLNYYTNDLSGEQYERMINMLSEADPSFDIN